MDDFMLTIEAFAHYMRGAVTLFFIFWCFILYAFVRRNRMMKLLFASTLYLTFSFLKDAIFLVNPWKNSEYLDNLVNVADLLCYPLVCAYFLEAVRPGFSTMTKIVGAFCVQALFVPLFLIYPSDWVMGCAFTVSNVTILYTLIAVMLFAFRYQHMLFLNYSYQNRIDVVWVAIACLVYFLTHYIYMYAFDHTTWLSEALFDLYSILIWTALFLLSRRHKVVLAADLFKQRMSGTHAQRMEAAHETETAPVEGTGNDLDAETDHEALCAVEVQSAAEQGHPQMEPAAEGQTDSQEPAGRELNRDTLLAQRLNHCMVHDKPYLIPKLSLGDLALAIGTNKTYLSDYFNNNLHTTFYEYINRYRVMAARRMIYSMALSNRVNMDAVAEQSGFNSLSSFNRYFVKSMGVTPKQYYFSCLKGEEAPILNL